MDYFKTVKGKLTLLIINAVIGMLLLIGVSFYEMNSIYNTTNYANINAIPSIENLNKAFNEFSTLRVRVHRHLIAENQETKKESDKLIDESLNNVKDAFSKYQGLVSNQEDRNLLEEEQKLFAQYSEGLKPIIVLSNQYQTAEGVKQLIKIDTTIGRQLRKVFEKHVAFNKKIAQDQANLAKDSKSTGIIILFVILIISLIIIILIGTIIAKKLYRQLGGEPNYAVDITKLISQGNLSSRIQVQSGDNSSVLVSLDKMQNVLKSTVKNISQSAELVHRATLDLSRNTNQIHDASLQQSDASTSMASTVEELTVSIESIHHNSTETLHLAKQAKEFSEKSKGVINHAVDQIRSVATIVNISVELTKDLGRRSQEINSIVAIISEVAEQTNLLALNAAIEAARAGESGKGFAVVADEVRKLAERTSQSTGQIGEVINAIRNDIDKVVDNMNKSEENVNIGVNFAKQASESIDQIVDSSNQITNLIQDINISLEEQSSAGVNISQNIERIVDMSNQNNVAVEQTVNIANNLEAQANSLNKQIQYFKA